MRNPDSRVGRINMLTTGAAGTIRIYFEIFRTDLNLGIVRNLRYHITGYE